MAVNADTIREYISGVRHMSLGTANEDGSPCVTELDFVHGPDLTLCFRSLATRRHSRNISRDPRVSGTIVKQHELGEAVEGVSFIGMAVLLGAGIEQDAYAKLFMDQLDAQPDIVERAASPDGPQFYLVDVNEWHYYGAPEGGKPQTFVLPQLPRLDNFSG
jgi:uncharacterized protein YhbP (UPF0306 family)